MFAPGAGAISDSNHPEEHPTCSVRPGTGSELEQDTASVHVGRRPELVFAEVPLPIGTVSAVDY